MGSSVRSLTSSIGWHDRPSQLNVALVDDPANGDSFNPPPIGSPVYFILGGFTFNGIFKSWRQRRSTQGFPVYEVSCTDCREVLACCQVIVGGYNGPVNIRNLLNVYGYYENSLGFGGSLSNDQGMPFSLIRTGIEELTVGINPIYGNSLVLAGQGYNVDLSGLPATPIYYRIPGPSINLLQLINQVCEQNGFDYYVLLDGITIRIRTVSRQSQPPLGTISFFVNNNQGLIVQNENGLELRNEPTSAFVTGGPVQELWMTDAIVPFWGWDINGAPILGVGAGNAHAFNANASEVADLIGSTVYPTTVLELRFALGGLTTWMDYMKLQRPQYADALDITAVYDVIEDDLVLPVDVKNDELNRAVVGAEAVQTEAVANIKRFYGFVHKLATNFMGRTFLARIPFLLQYTESETGRIIRSHEVANDGAFVPEGSTPLGLDIFNQDKFQAPDTKFYAFVKFTNLTNVNLEEFNLQDAVIEPGDGLFVKVQVEPVIQLTPFPAVIITLSSPLYELDKDVFGDIDLLAAFLNINPNDFAEVANKNQGGFIDLKVGPIPRQPDFAAIPLRSNINVYGPWYAQSTIGKVEYVQDPGLVPWNYGSYSLLGLAGLSIATGYVTNMLISELGSVEVAGIPQYNLGDVLVQSGPNITDINISYNTDGITTTYSFETFIQRFGRQGKENAERISRIGQIIRAQKQELKQAFIQAAQRAQIIGNAFRGALALREPPEIERGSPHDMFVAIQDGTRTAVTTSTFEESVVNIGAYDDTLYGKTAAMSLNGLLRPFSTNTSEVGMPRYDQPNANFNGGLSIETIDPFDAGNEIQALVWGSTYQGLNALARGATSSNTRALALRGPMVMTGWGYDIHNQLVGSIGSPANWKTGPVDLVWHDYRAVWTCHDIARCRTTGVLGAGDSQNVFLYANGETTQTILVNNFFSTPISGNTLIIAGYDANDRNWYVIAADCILPV